MRMRSLSVSNFLALKYASFDNLPQAIMIAGANGSGKSCLLDAVRLIKSACGSYQTDEWNAFLGERHIDLNRDPRELLAMFRDQSRPVEISASFEFTPDEIAFVADQAEQLAEELLIREDQGDAGIPRARRIAPGSQKARQFSNQAKEFAVQVRESLALPQHHARLRMEPNKRPEVKATALLKIAFSTYQPSKLGIFDFHGPSRNYGRQRVNSINLTIESSADRDRSHALYNYSNKYANIKTEMGSAYVRHLLMRAADPGTDLDDSLTRTLKELFQKFFPGKTFVGPTPTDDGKLLFPVRLESGIEHDIDELSSGEKEVLFGYLRLHGARLCRSIVLIDEPELHLNPKLIAGLAAFYQKHVAMENANQLWLVTHSDALIREALDCSNYAVYHLQAASEADENQLESVTFASDVDRVVLQLVGDMAAYRPRSRTLLVEGAGEVEFDALLIRTFFPEFARKVNVIPVGTKTVVRGIYSLLDEIRTRGAMSEMFYAVIDRDSREEQTDDARTFVWPVYHIENFLLDVESIEKTVAELGCGNPALQRLTMVAALHQCATEVSERQIRHRVGVRINSAVVRKMNLRIAPEQGDARLLFRDALLRSQNRVNEAVEGLLGRDLIMIEAEERSRVEESLQGDEWRSEIAGREILTRFTAKFLNGITYEIFRNALMRQIAKDSRQPTEMRTLLDAVSG
jgi:predicted ATPase